MLKGILKCESQRKQRIYSVHSLYLIAHS